MNIVNLQKYISNWLILNNLSKQNPFDMVIYEEKKDNQNFNEYEDQLNIHSLDELDYDFGLSGKLNQLTKDKDNILLIIDQTNIEYLIPFLNSTDSNFSIINLSAGASNFINKKNYISPDIGILSNYDTNVYEPYDFISLFKVLQNKENNYIRAMNKDISMNMFREADKQEKFKDIVNLTEFEMKGSHGTLITWGSSLSSTIKAANKLKDDGHFYDLFTILNYNFEINDEIKTSLEKTEKLILVLDINPKDVYLKTIKSKLREKGLWDTQIHLVCPKASQIDTHLADYVYNKADFDSEGIYEQIKAIYEPQNEK